MLRHIESVHRQVHRHVVLQRDKLQGDPRQIREFEQIFAPLVLFDLTGPRQERIEIAILVDK